MSALYEHATTPAREPRGALRLRMSEQTGHDRLDGGWWPYTRDLVLEMTDLAQHFPPAHGRIVSAEFSRPDWDTVPRRVTAGARTIRMGSCPDDDTHELVVETSNRGCLTLLVIPPRFTAGQGAEALLAAATPGNSHPGGELLMTVTDQPDVDPADLWGRDEDGTPNEGRR